MALELVAMRFQTDVLDIHAGGVDLIFPHHEDEIAQSCAYTGKNQFARFWLHGEFLDIGGTKMSKRYGNILTPRDLREDGIPPGAVRLLMFGTHYRKKLDWRDEALAAAREASHRLGEFQNRLLSAQAERDSPLLVQASQRLTDHFEDALNDDLNAPRALAAMFAFVNEVHAALDAGQQAGPATLAAWNKAEGVLGVTTAVATLRVKGGSPVKAGGQMSELPPDTPPADSVEALRWAQRWAEIRAAHKSQRNFAQADRIRALLAQHGFQVRDARDGSIEVVRVAAPRA
jgi:cysteinyl-tRNA synthetase